jgi:hypothetical protein
MAAVEPFRGILEPVTWLLIAGAFVAGLGMAQTVHVRRCSPSHIVGEVALRGRGLFFSRTPDGTWWRLRLRARRCGAGMASADQDDPPADESVREPRRPRGPGPATAAVLRSTDG